MYRMSFRPTGEILNNLHSDYAGANVSCIRFLLVPRRNDINGQGSVKLLLQPYQPVNHQIQLFLFVFKHPRLQV